MKNHSAVLGLLLVWALPTWHSSAKDREWHAENGFRWAELDVPKTGKTGFTFLPPEQTGLYFTNTLGEWEGAANRVLYNGSGVAVGDYDSDGLPDIFLCGLNTPNALYKNLGNWKFKDVTAEAGLVFSGKNFRGAVFADINGDGFSDLLVATTGRGVLCFLNDGHGKFKDITEAAGTGSHHGSVGMTLADIDGNGTLDLYIVNNRPDDIRDRGQVDVQMVKGKLSIPPALKDRLVVLDGRVEEYGEPDQMLLNDGKGHFTPMPWTGGRFLDEDGKKLEQPPLDWGLTAGFHDLNNDGFPDLYVCNDYWTPDRIWLNDGKGNFRAIDRLAIRCTSASSMGVDFADIDRDGNTDIFVLDMLSRDSRLRKRQMLAQTPHELPVGAIDNRPQILRNTLLHNRGDGTFEEIACYSGLEASEWSWSPVFLDVDLDGYEDLLVAPGHIKDVQDLDAGKIIHSRQRSYSGYTNAVERQKAFTTDKMLNGRFYPPLHFPIIAFRNLGHLKFEEVTSLWGTEQLGVHHGIALADFDNDGDMDFIVNNLNGGVGIYRNDTVAPRVAVRLKGLSPNTQGIGSKITLLNGAVPMQSQEIACGGRYMSGSEAMLVFAAGPALGGMTLEVNWRSGRSSTVRDVHPNRLYEIDESGASSDTQQATPASVEPTAGRRTTPSPPPLFADVTHLIAHTHHEEAFDDFERQPLLPAKLSQAGPGVAWYDLDGDGHDDLIIGAGRGGVLSVYRNDGQGHFTKDESAIKASQTLSDDMTGIVGWTPAPGQRALLLGQASYEVIGSPSVVRLDWSGTELKLGQTLPSAESSAGPLAVADMDGAGNLDLFVGGRVIPGRWPERASSRIFHHHGKQLQLQLDIENSRLLEKVGCVTGAVWSDLDGDGFPELLLACEWGSIKIFRNDHGRLAPWDPPLTFPAKPETRNSKLGTLTGLWSGLTTGDVDGDGKLDIIAGNWGFNSAYRATPEQPLRIYYGDLAGQGATDLLETEYDPVSKAIVARRPMNGLARVMPFLLDRFTTFKSFSEATVAEILRDRKANAQEAQAATLASTVFLNRGDHFEVVELPAEAQLAPAFSVSVGDFDGDGHEDIFLSQNFFATRPDVPRLDAGRGLWLRGDGTGRFQAVPGQVSGIKVYGEQRGAALADFNEDGRVDVVVTQNGAATKLYQNVAAKPGLRVRLAGPPGNPTGVGATVRLMFGERLGPAREIHAGSGYWSQDSATQVLATPEQPTKIWVRWPGGKVTTTDVAPASREVTVEALKR